MPNFVYFAFPIPGLCKYTDMSVGQTLPGSSTPFTLENYKSDLLKPHSKLHFGCVSRMSLRMLTVAPVMMPFVLHRWRLTKGSQQLLLVCHSIPLYHSHPHQPSSTKSGSTLALTRGKPSATCTKSTPVAFHQCPTCFELFAQREIESYAD